MHRLKQPFNMLKFLERNMQYPADAHESQYTSFEERRENSFQESMFQFRRKFTEAEEIQSAGERGRTEVFDRINADCKETFEKYQLHREQLYLEASAQQDTTHREHETIREATFQDGQSKRAAMYEMEHTTLTERSTWYHGTRESILTNGRHARETACIDTEAALADQFASLLKAMEDDFVRRERQRDEVVQALTVAQSHLEPVISESDPRIIDAMNASDTYIPDPDPILTNPDGQAPSTAIQMPSGSTTHVPFSEPANVTHDNLIPSSAIQMPSLSSSPPRVSRFARLRGSLSRSWSPRYGGSNSLPALRSKRGCVRSLTPPHMRRTPSRSLSRSPERPLITSVQSPYNYQPALIAQPTPCQPSSCHTSTKESSLDPKSTQDGSLTSVDPFQERFLIAQDRRRQEFSEEEERRAELFKAAEVERDTAEDRRIITWGKEERHRRLAFQSMLDVQQTLYRTKEDSRASADTKRHYVFHITQKRHDHAFAMSLSDLEEQAQAEDSYEQAINEEMRSRMETACNRHVALLRKARKDQAHRFLLAQQRRLKLLSVIENIDVTSDASELSFRSAPSQASFGFKLEFEDEHDDFPRRHAWRFGRPRSRGRYRTAIGALVKGVTTLKPLPLPQIEQRVVLEMIRQKQSFQEHQRHRNIIFQRSQSCFEEKFETSMEERQRAWVVSEQRRTAEFEKQQSSRRVIFVDREDQRKTEFTANLQRRQIIFMGAELGRDNEFHQAEEARDNEFRASQKDRQKRFHARQQRLQKHFIQLEKTRLVRLERCRDRLFQKLGDEMEGYEIDERLREKVFRKILA
ncbi:hypothetical protein H0H87_001924 [Tephrocybe sp. NHM501043]|nr:hypothetical protein H0H87_001924 [Tephrocybe sp. NHM501043]